MNEEVIAENEKALAGFAASENKTITPVLQRVLDEIKQTGVPFYPWPQLRAVLVVRLKTALDEMRATDKSAAVVVGWSPTNKNKFDDRRDNLAALLNAFDGPPFTLQRLTEVILEPHKTYKSLNKLFNALEKLLAVTSTIPVVDPRQGPPTEEDTGPPAPPSITVTPIAAPTPQAVQGTNDLDVVARAPWSGAELSSPASPAAPTSPAT